MKRTGLFLFTLPLLLIPALAGDLDQILEKHFQAVGGEKKLAGITSIKMKGVIKVQSLEVPFAFVATKNKCRLDMSTKGIKTTKIFDGRKGWEINPMLGSDEPHPLNAEETRRLTNFIDDLQGPLAQWQQRGYKVTYHGQQNIDGRNFHKISVLTANGRKRTLFLDPSTYLVGGFIEGNDDNLQNLTRVLSYITTTDGMTFPRAYRVGLPNNCCHSLHAPDTQCGAFREIEHRTLEVNQPVDDRIFRVDATAASLLAEN